MHDAIYNIIEQQQKIINMCNKMCIPEIIRMQQSYSNIINQIQPSISIALQNEMKLSSSTEKIVRSLNSDKFISSYIRAIERDKQLTKGVTSALTYIERTVSMAQKLTFPTDAIVNILRALSLQSESIISDVYDTVQNIPDSLWNTLDEEGYSREEIQTELEEMKTDAFEITDVKRLTRNHITDKFWIWLGEKYPKVASVLQIVMFIVSMSSVVLDVIDFNYKVCIPMAQNTMVKIQGKDDILFVKVDAAKIYTEPDSRSTIITKIMYAEEVTQIDSVNMWVKVTYINLDGEEIEGWIAKRNLMTYRDYEFNSDDLYDID